MTTQRALRATSPDDLLAAVPVVLGFHPETSIVMLTFGSPLGSFHARTDLPARPEVSVAISPLLEAATRNEVARVAFILYSDDGSLATFVARRLTQSFCRHGIDVVTVLRADGKRWFQLDPRVAPGPGHPYDVSRHPFTVQAVYDGAVTHRDRASLAASVEARPEGVAGVATALPAALMALGGLNIEREQRWISRLLRLADAGDRTAELDDEEVARLLVALADDRLRDIAWLAIRRRTATVHVALWTDIVQRSPEELVGPPAWLLAFAAWQAGQGALAWCALERCRRVDPDCSLVERLEAVLEQALPPGSWEEFLDADAGSRGKRPVGEAFPPA